MNIGIWAGNRGPEATAFEDALFAQCTRLGLPLNFDRKTAFALPARGRLTVVFLDPNSALPPDAELKAFLTDGGTVLPIARTAPEAGKCVAGSAIEAVNALLQDAHGAATEWVDAAVDEVLAHLWVRRRSKRVFVSYRRVDASEIARQLFDALNRRGFEVFLDEATIAPIANFQERLKWWLNDADLVLLLASPRIGDSKWVLEEIEFVKKHQIGVLAVEWPQSVYEDGEPFAGLHAAPSEPSAVVGGLFPYQRYRLPRTDFEDPSPGLKGEASRLTDDGLDRLIARARRNRTLALRDRLNDLVQFTKDHFQKRGIAVTQEAPGDFRYFDGTLSHLLRVLPFRPDHNVCHELAQAASEAACAGCLYTESSPSEAEVVALLWCLEATREFSGRNAALPLRLWRQPGGPLP